jgi:hypothetical protein
MHVDYRIGKAIWDLTLALAVASIVLVWRRSTRTHIPLATLALVGFMNRSLPTTSDEDRKTMEADIAAMRAMMADPQYAPVARDVVPEPSGSEARGIRAMLKATEDMRSWMLSLAEEYRFGPGKEPRAAFSPAYLADAGRHPEVGDYYTWCPVSTP